MCILSGPKSPHQHAAGSHPTSLLPREKVKCQFYLLLDTMANNACFNCLQAMSLWRLLLTGLKP